MNEYKLSIVVPTFNLETEIDKTLGSIKSQTLGFENIEVIFVDDNSTDNTFNILNDFSAEYDNVRVFRTDENSGYAGKPRNIGIENSKTNYVLFLDGDDQLLVDACEVLYNKMLLSAADIVIGGQINVFENGIQQHNPPLNSGNENHFKNMNNPELLKIRPAISAKLFKKTLLTENSIKFPEGIPGQDLLFLLEAILNSSNIITLNNFYVYYRNLNSNSITLKLTNDYFYGLINAYSLVCDLFNKYNVDKNIQEIVLHDHLSFFGERTIAAHYSDDYDNINLDEIFKSELFNDLSNKDIFKSNYNFSLYFERLKNGEYNNRDLLNTIYQTFDFDSEIIHDLKYIKNEISKLNIKPNKIQEDNAYLRKVNLELSQENERLTHELNEIKSSKLWKFKNKFN